MSDELRPIRVVVSVCSRCFHTGMWEATDTEPGSQVREVPRGLWAAYLAASGSALEAEQDIMLALDAAARSGEAG